MTPAASSQEIPNPGRHTDQSPITSRHRRATRPAECPPLRSHTAQRPSTTPRRPRASHGQRRPGPRRARTPARLPRGLPAAASRPRHSPRARARATTSSAVTEAGQPPKTPRARHAVGQSPDTPRPPHAAATHARPGAPQGRSSADPSRAATPVMPANKMGPQGKGHAAAVPWKRPSLAAPAAGPAAPSSRSQPAERHDPRSPTPGVVHSVLGLALEGQVPFR